MYNTMPTFVIDKRELGMIIECYELHDMHTYADDDVMKRHVSVRCHIEKGRPDRFQRRRFHVLKTTPAAIISFFPFSFHPIITKLLNSLAPSIIPFLGCPMAAHETRYNVSF